MLNSNGYGPIVWGRSARTVQEQCTALLTPLVLMRVEHHYTISLAQIGIRVPVHP